MSLPTADCIELWFSTTGTLDSDFSLLATLPNAYSTTDYTAAGGIAVAPNYVYALRERRFLVSAQAYSEWTPIVYARAPSPPESTTTTMATTYYSDQQSKLSLGMQDPVNGIEWVPVIAQTGLDRKSGQLDMEDTDSDVVSLMGITDDLEKVPNTSKVTGSPVLNVRIQDITHILAMAYGAPVTTAIAAVAASAGPPATPAVAAHFSHVFTKGFSQIPATIHEIRGPQVYAFPGSRVTSLSIDTDKTQSDNLVITADMLALNQIVLNAASDCGINLVGYDTEPAFGMAQIAAAIGSGDPTILQKVTIKDDLKLKEIQGLTGTRGPVSHARVDSEATIDVTAFFSTDAEMKMYFNQLSTIAAPYGKGNVELYVPFTWSATGAVSATTGYANSVTFNATKAALKKVGKPVRGKNLIMQELSIKVYSDLLNNGTALTWTVVNGQTNANIVTPAAAIVTPLAGYRDAVQVYTG